MTHHLVFGRDPARELIESLHVPGREGIDIFRRPGHRIGGSLAVVEGARQVSGGLDLRPVIPRGPLVERQGDAGRHPWQQAVRQLIEALAGARIADLPFTGLVVVVLRLDARLAGEYRAGLLIEDVGVLVEIANPFAHIQLAGLGLVELIERDPLAAVLAVGCRVADEVLGLALEGGAENVLLGPLGHQDELVAPAGDIDIEHLLRVVLPRRLHDLAIGADSAFIERARLAVDRLLKRPVLIAELVERPVAGGVEHGPALRLVELVETLVIALGVVATRRRGGAVLVRFGGIAGVAPVDHQPGICRPGAVVEVIDAFGQHLAELAVCAGAGIGVVVADLRQRDVHRLLAGSDRNELGADLLGHLRLDIGDLGHQDRACHHPGGSDDHLHRLFSGGVDRFEDLLDARDPGIGIQGHGTACEQGDAALFRLQQPLALDQDVAARQLGARDGGFHALTRPGHVDARSDHDVAGGTDGAAYRRVAASAQQHQAGAAGHLERAVDRHLRCDQVQQRVCLRDRRILAGSHGTA